VSIDVKLMLIMFWIVVFSLFDSYEHGKIMKEIKKFKEVRK